MLVGTFNHFLLWHNEAEPHLHPHSEQSAAQRGKINRVLKVFISWARGDFWFWSTELNILRKGVKKQAAGRGMRCFQSLWAGSWLNAETVASSGQLLSSGKALDIKQVNDWSLWSCLSWMEGFPRSVLILLFKSIWKKAIFPAFPPSVFNFQNACSSGLQACRKVQQFSPRF